MDFFRPYIRTQHVENATRARIHYFSKFEWVSLISFIYLTCQSLCTISAILMHYLILSRITFCLSFSITRSIHGCRRLPASGTVVSVTRPRIIKNHHLCRIFCATSKILQFFGTRDRISMRYPRRKQIFNNFSAPLANFLQFLGFRPLILPFRPSSWPFQFFEAIISMCKSDDNYFGRYLGSFRPVKEPWQKKAGKNVAGRKRPVKQEKLQRAENGR